MKSLKIFTLILVSVVMQKLSAQAPNVEIKMCGPVGGTKTIGAFKMTLKCNLCCQGTQPLTYYPIHKCMPNKTTICGTDFLLNPPNGYTLGGCQTCITIIALPATFDHPVRLQVIAHSIGRYWIVSGYTDLVDEEYNGIEVDLEDIIEGDTDGLIYNP